MMRKNFPNDADFEIKPKMFAAKMPGTHYPSPLLYNHLIQIEIIFANGNQFLLLLFAFLTIRSVGCGKVLGLDY